MKLSTKGEYALEAMVELACSYETGPLTSGKISAKRGISRMYLDQLFNKLRKAGLVKSTKGPNGGYVLAKKPSQMKAGDVIRAVEGPIALVDCANPDKNIQCACSRTKDCATRALWKKVSLAVAKVLDDTSLEALVKR